MFPPCVSGPPSPSSPYLQPPQPTQVPWAALSLLGDGAGPRPCCRGQRSGRGLASYLVSPPLGT